MKKWLIFSLLNFSLFHYSTPAEAFYSGEEWSGFVPVCLKDNKLHFLLKKQYHPSDDSSKAERITIVPPIGSFRNQRPNYENIPQFFENFLKISGDMEDYLKKVPYSYFHHTNYSSTIDITELTPEQKELFSTLFPLLQESLLEKKQKYFDSDSNAFETHKTISISFPKYKIYHIPIKETEDVSGIEKDMQWFSLEEVKKFNNTFPSLFTQDLVDAFELSQEEKDEIGYPNVTIEEAWENHFNLCFNLFPSVKITLAPSAT